MATWHGGYSGGANCCHMATWHGGYSGGKKFVSAVELCEKLSHLRHEKVLTVKLVDIVDFNGSFLARIRDLAGANLIILVVTKCHLCSSHQFKVFGGDYWSYIRDTEGKKGRDVYILGSANVGNSAFINALLKMMARKDPVAAAAQKYKPMQSAVPGTTLGPIQIEAFREEGCKLFDTPGVHLHHRQAAVVHSEDLPTLAPQSRLRGFSFPVLSAKNIKNDINAVGLNGISIFWGGLVRIDVLKVLPTTRLTFYEPLKVPILTVRDVEADEFYQREVGVTLTPPSGKQREIWPGLQVIRHLQIKFEDGKRPACDIAISGLGWIAVETFGMETDNQNESELTGELQFAVHVPKPVEIFVRPPLPVGKAGAKWYQYQELTEKEEELKPKWYH